MGLRCEQVTSFKQNKRQQQNRCFRKKNRKKNRCFWNKTTYGEHGKTYTVQLV